MSSFEDGKSVLMLLSDCVGDTWACISGARISPQERKKKPRWKKIWTKDWRLDPWQLHAGMNDWWSEWRSERLTGMMDESLWWMDGSGGMNDNDAWKRNITP